MVLQFDLSLLGPLTLPSGDLVLGTPGSYVGPLLKQKLSSFPLIAQCSILGGWSLLLLLTSELGPIVIIWEEMLSMPGSPGPGPPSQNK